MYKIHRCHPHLGYVCALVNSVEEGLPLLSLNLPRNVVTSSSSIVVSSIGPGKEVCVRVGGAEESSGSTKKSSGGTAVKVRHILCGDQAERVG